MAQVKFPRFRRTTLSQMALQALLDLVQQGILQPGDKLPPQRQLEAQMGVSRTALREAISGLAAMGIVEVSVARGTFIRQVPPEMLINPAALYFQLERDTLLQAIEVREALEVEAITLAAQRATEDDLAELGHALKQIQRGLRSKKPLENAPNFHLAIAKCAHNPMLFNILKSLHGLLRREAQVIAKHVAGAELREYRGHAELYEPIVRRDPKEARRRMHAHLVEAREMILQGFSAAGAREEESSSEERDPDRLHNISRISKEKD